jgi:hypothetical protein
VLFTVHTALVAAASSAVWLVLHGSRHHSGNVGSVPARHCIVRDWFSSAAPDGTESGS